MPVQAETYEREFRAMLRPVIEDAADSIEYATGYPAAKSLAWFDGLDVAEIQHLVMGAVQNAITSALAIDENVDYSA